MPRRLRAVLTPVTFRRRLRVETLAGDSRMLFMQIYQYVHITKSLRKNHCKEDASCCRYAVWRMAVICILVVAFLRFSLCLLRYREEGGRGRFEPSHSQQEQH